MKINYIRADHAEDGNTSVSVSFDADVSVVDAIAYILARFGDAAPAISPPLVELIQAPVEQVTRTRTRKPAAVVETPASVPATEETASPNAEASGVRRRRQVATDAPPAITDADLSKAASHAATIIGTEVVMAVLGDMGVSAVGELKDDVRKRFLDEIAEEVRLAEDEAAASKAG